MKYNVITTWGNYEKIRELHVIMFHGKALELPGVYYLGSHDLDDDLSYPMTLQCNAYNNVPPIFQPERSVNLVISENVKNLLESVPNITLLPVVFDKLIEYSYEIGDFSYYDSEEYLSNPKRGDPSNLFDRLPDVPELHEKIGNYYELVVYEYEKIRSELERQGIIVPEIETENIDAGEYPGPYEISNVALMELEKYPIFRSSKIFIETSIFNRLHKFFHPDFFESKEIELFKIKN